MIEVNGLTKKYGNHLVVNDLTFNVEKGKVYGFLGPNGAGKSTTMNIITGYLAATSGTVKVNGFDILREPEEAKKCIGYLPEMPPLYPDMTVLEYLIFAAELKKIPKRARRDACFDVMNKTMISDMKNRMIKNLSKGYKQRVGLAQAMLGNPEVIILDEPTVGLDPKQIIEIRELILNLKKDHTIILSSHILSEVSAVCDEIMIISKGRLVADDTPENLEKMMAGEVHVEIDTWGSEASLIAVLDNIDGIETYSLKKKDDYITTDITVKKNMEIRDRLSIELGRADIPVYRLVLDQKSLEDIFLELTNNKTLEHSDSSPIKISSSYDDMDASSCEKKDETLTDSSDEDTDKFPDMLPLSEDDEDEHTDNNPEEVTDNAGNL